MSYTPYPRAIFFDNELYNKFKKISFQMKLNKDSLINYWLSKELDTQEIHYANVEREIVTSFMILNEITAKLEKISHQKGICLSTIAYAHLKAEIDKTYEWLNSPAHKEDFQKIINSFEMNTDIKNWPNVAFRNRKLK